MISRRFTKGTYPRSGTRPTSFRLVRAILRVVLARAGELRSVRPHKEGLGIVLPRILMSILIGLACSSTYAAGHDNADPLLAFRRCPAVAPSSVVLATRADSSGSITIGLPEGVRPDAGGNFLHGGQSWSQGDVTVRLTLGYWWPDSFEVSPSESRCRARIGGMDALVIESRHDGRISLITWFLKSLNPYDAVIHVMTSEKKRLLAWAIVSSVRRRMTGRQVQPD
jgi:hypothetical protein